MKQKWKLIEKKKTKSHLRNTKRVTRLNFYLRYFLNPLRVQQLLVYYHFLNQIKPRWHLQVYMFLSA